MNVAMRWECVIGLIAVLAGCGREGGVSGMPTVTFHVPDMMCAEGCGAKTKEILSEQPGVKDVLVDFDTKSATVAVDEGEFDSDAAIAALVDHGFEQSSLKRESGQMTKPNAAIDE